MVSEAFASVQASPKVEVHPNSEGRAWLLPSPGDLLFVACLVLALGLGSSMLSRDGDPSRHLAVGDLILRSAAIPHRDVFSHTMLGSPFVPYEWLAEVLSAASYRLAGLAGPVLLHGSVIAVSFLILYRHLRLAGRSVALAGGVVLLASVSALPHWLARPHVFTFLGTAFFLLVLEAWLERRASPRALLLLIPAIALWANLHGGFLIGLILLAIYIGSDVLRLAILDEEARQQTIGRLRQLAPVAIAALAATAANPAGPELLRHATGYLGKRLLIDRTVEYMSPDFHRPTFWPFLLMLLATVAALAWSRRRPRFHEGLLFLAFAYFALYSARNVPLFALVIAPTLAAQLAALPRPRVLIPWVTELVAALERRAARLESIDARTRSGWWPALLLALLLVASVRDLSGGRAPLGLRIDPTLQPVAAVAYVLESPPEGRMFNKLAWGGYLIHHLTPGQPVFIDGQTDFYGEELARDYLAVTELQRGWRDVLVRYDVGWVMFSTDAPLTRALQEDGWITQYQDEIATVLERSIR